MLNSTAIHLKNNVYIQVFYQENTKGQYDVFIQKDQYLFKVTENHAFIGALLTHPYYLAYDEAESVLQQFKYNMFCGPCMGDTEKFNEFFPEFK